MKKVILALTLLLVSLVGNAQVNHLKFLGIPIDGTQQNFETKLVNKGFQSVMWKGERYLEGSFLGQKIRLQTAIGPRTGKVAIVGMLTHQEYSGGMVLAESERWKSRLSQSYNTSFYEIQNGNAYKAETNNTNGRGNLAIDILQSDPSKDLYVVRITLIDSENIGK